MDDSEPVLECRARMININLGHNQELMESCKRLRDYSYFIAEINKNLDKGYALETAVKKAMDECIKKGVLEDVLEKNRSEVFHMLLTEYDEKLHFKTLREAGREEGYIAGHKAGHEEGLDLKLIEQVCKKMAKGKSPEVIADELEEEESVIHGIYQVALTYAPEYDCKKIYDEWKVLNK